MNPIASCPAINNMKKIKAGFEILMPTDGEAMLRHIEACGRVCYKSEGSITEDSYLSFIGNILSRGHSSVIEHASFTVRFTIDRGVSHEIVRHRIASYSQESTRYCNYSGGKFGREITVIEPCFFQPGTPPYTTWEQSCIEAERQYFALLDSGCTAQQARSVLPNSLKTDLLMTANLREWRHFLGLRTSPAAHPQMREVAIPLLFQLQKEIPVIFDDIEVNA